MIVNAVLATLLAGTATATIALPSFFASSMVLRADVPVLLTGVEDNPAGEGALGHSLSGLPLTRPPAAPPAPTHTHAAPLARLSATTCMLQPKPSP
jgi:hypothetical protein